MAKLVLSDPEELYTVEVAILQSSRGALRARPYCKIKHSIEGQDPMEVISDGACP